MRALHHYEHVGLLPPAHRTDGRQRQYGTNDVRRLYVIRALRDLGLSLTEVRRTLDGGGPALGDILRSHRARVASEIERLRQLQKLLDHACEYADGEPDVDGLLAMIAAMSRVARRVEERSDDRRLARETRSAWRALGIELRASLNAGEAPSSSRARAVARAALARLEEFAGGDRATLDALAHLREFAPPQAAAGWDPELFRYLNRAIASLRDETPDESSEGRVVKAKHRVVKAKRR